MGALMVYAKDGEFEVRFDPKVEGIRFEATHQGLVGMAAVMEAVGGRVFMTPSLTRPEITGMPAEFDAKGFVETACTLSQLGWSSAPGGEA